MRKRWFLSGALLLLLSCVNELDELAVADTKTMPLVVSVSNVPMTKGQVSGVYMPEGAELGLFLRAADGSRYDGLSIRNVKYTASGTASAQSWGIEGGYPIGLTTTVGTAYAFYPWFSADFSDLKVPITNDGTDWMYAASAAQNLSVANHQASFLMKHAMTIIRCKIVRGDYPGEANVTTVGVSSPGLATSGCMDLVSSLITDLTGIGSEIQAKKVGVLGAEPIFVDLWGIATTSLGALSFRIVADGDVYLASSDELTLTAGGVYNYTITVNAESIEISDVSIEDWVVAPSEGLVPDVALLQTVSRSPDDYSVNWLA